VAAAVAAVVAVAATVGLGTSGQDHRPAARAAVAPPVPSASPPLPVDDLGLSSPPAPALRAEPLLPRHLPRTSPTTSVRAGGFYFI
jgi:hypothetical protein